MEASKQPLSHVLIFLWIAAGLAVPVSFMINGGWSAEPPLWWWILTVAVVISGAALSASGRRKRYGAGSSLSFWRELPPILQPLGVWGTFQLVLFVGFVLPSLALAFLVWGNAAGRIIGAGLVLLWLWLCNHSRRHSRRV